MFSRNVSKKNSLGEKDEAAMGCSYSCRDGRT